MKLDYKNTVYVCEMAPGKFLRINQCEDGNGTWWDFTDSIFDAYWMQDRERLEEIALTEFHDFKEDFPRMRKISIDIKEVPDEE